MINLIIGKNSNLSRKLSEKLDNVIAISAKDILEGMAILDPFVGKQINIIFNNFQTATKLNDIQNPIDYVEYSLGSTSKVLQYTKEYGFKINKIIYTSSSSVYGNNILCKESDELKPLSLHAALKVANEKLIAQYCLEYSIDYSIARIFNMYGGNDNFSVISKLLKCCNSGKIFIVANHGSAIRDFINIDDVVTTYAQLLQVKNLPIINLGTGEGISIKNIIYFLRIHHIDLNIKNISKEEIKMSTADNSLLMQKLDKTSFIRVEEYLLEQLQQ